MNIKTCPHGVRGVQSCKICAKEKRKARDRKYRGIKKERMKTDPEFRAKINKRRRELQHARWEEHPEEHDEHKRSQREWYGNNKERMRMLGIFNLYGLTEKQYLQLMKKQNGKCPICNRKFNKMKTKSINIDHDHKTMKVRGILCMNCNNMLGCAKDSIKILMKGIAYLQRHSAKK